MSLEKESDLHGNMVGPALNSVCSYTVCLLALFEQYFIRSANIQAHHYHGTVHRRSTIMGFSSQFIKVQLNLFYATAQGSVVS